MRQPPHLTINIIQERCKLLKRLVRQTQPVTRMPLVQPYAPRVRKGFQATPYHLCCDAAHGRLTLRTHINVLNRSASGLHVYITSVPLTCTVFSTLIHDLTR